jgi:hypothetical protein
MSINNFVTILLISLFSFTYIYCDSTCSKNAWIKICIDGGDYYNNIWGTAKITSGKQHDDISSTEIVNSLNKIIEARCAWDRQSGKINCVTNYKWKSYYWSNQGNIEFDCNSGGLMRYGFNWRSRDYYC